MLRIGRTTPARAIATRARALSLSADFSGVFFQSREGALGLCVSQAARRPATTRRTRRSPRRSPRCSTPSVALRRSSSAQCSSASSPPSSRSPERDHDTRRRRERDSSFFFLKSSASPSLQERRACEEASIASRETCRRLTIKRAYAVKNCGGKRLHTGPPSSSPAPLRATTRRHHSSSLRLLMRCSWVGRERDPRRDGPRNTYRSQRRQGSDV